MKIVAKIKEEYLGLGKHYPIKILRKVTGFSSLKNDIYVSKITGLVSVIFRRNSKEIAHSWNKKFQKGKKKNFNTKFYTATVPFVKSRLMNVLYTTNNYINFKKKKIIDLGCGEGVLLIEAKKLNQAKKILGVDPSYNNCQILKSKKISSFCGTAENFAKIKKYHNYFDICFITWTLCNSSNCYDIIKTANKILKKNGILIVAESSRILAPFKKSIYDYITKRKKIDLHPFHFSKNTLKNLLIINKFKIMFTNEYINNNEVIIIGKKINKIEINKIKTDSYKLVNDFFKKWILISKYYSKLKKI
jgi:2-polyprenyl-3-methyl-5-hydroxy-6-metoxy-1,4-benzoquinol methylase